MAKADQISFVNAVMSVSCSRSSLRLILIASFVRLVSVKSTIPITVHHVVSFLHSQSEGERLRRGSRRLWNPLELILPILMRKRTGLFASTWANYSQMPAL